MIMMEMKIKREVGEKKGKDKDTLEEKKGVEDNKQA